MKFEVIYGDEELFQNKVDQYNKTYHTDFEIIEFKERDGVEFATIQAKSAKLEDIFQLGCLYGMMIEIKRQRHEIDW